MAGRWRRCLKFAIRGLAVALLALGGFIGLRWWTGNHGEILAGQVYRSAQLTPEGLTRTIDRHGIKTVLNLRGSNPDEPWYRAERAATLAAGATQVDMALASNLWLTRDQARTLVEVLDTSEPPVLMHCQWGAERTGLVAAIVELLRPGGSIASARAQFTPYYLFLPIKDGVTMTAHVDLYAGWLESEGLDHSPEAFRRWIGSEYVPGSPSREQWPYDPYPLAVIARPPGDADGARVAGPGDLDAPASARR